MKPIPVAFHVGPLEVHTYGIGLAVTFWFAYRYFERRLVARGYRSDWVPQLFVWVVVAAVVGARTMHVLTNLSFYSQNPGDVLAVWRGGLSSFGGLLLAVPTAMVVTKRSCPELPLPRAFDIVAPVLMAAWSMGRLLGPQLMVAGGGHRTHQWFGMYYAGQPGRRIPVPIIQALEDFAVFCLLIVVERRLERRLERRPYASSWTDSPSGAVLGVAMVAWGIERAVDERLWLGEDGHLGSALVQVAGVALVVGGAALLVRSSLRWRTWVAAESEPDLRSLADARSTVETAPRVPPQAPSG